MNFLSVLNVVLASQLQPALADDTHAKYLASVSSYKPTAGFNHVVGPTRFVGYFLQAPDACRVTVFKAAADDDALVSSPQRIDLEIAAAGRSELAASDGSALAFACTAVGGGDKDRARAPNESVRRALNGARGSRDCSIPGQVCQRADPAPRLRGGKR
jgi:hypothetical protein